jgi:hypothetical protein
MSERERRTGTGGTGDNVQDDLNEASQGREKEDATKGAVEEEERTGGGGGVKDNVGNDQEKTQERS